MHFNNDDIILYLNQLLYATYCLFKYTVAWIAYYNRTDQRMPNSIWRYTCDYPVMGIRDISDLDDKSFVRLRRKRKSDPR